jgi:outer membrane biosynthesis protein TonB
MINILRHIAARSAATAVVAMLMVNTVHAQAPTDAQRSAIRSQCRSDYMAHCSSVPPGGIESLQCLQKNMSSLSASCKSAVNAVEAPAAAPKAETPKAETPKAETPKAETPAAEPAKPAEAAAPKGPASTAAEPAKTAAPAKKPSDAQVAAIRGACRSDYQKACASVPPGGAAALNCLEKNKAKLSPSFQQAVSAASGGGSAPATAAAPASGGSAAAAPAAAPATVIVLRPMRPREELFVLRSACGADVRGLCAGIPPGGGRIMQCLATQAASLSPACKDVLAQFAAQ